MEASGILPYPQKRDGDEENDIIIASSIRVRSFAVVPPSSPHPPFPQSTQEQLPFAVVGRNHEQKEDGKLKMYRRTRCGTVDGE